MHSHAVQRIDRLLASLGETELPAEAHTQGAVFVALKDFAFKDGRVVKVKAGSRFWKTNSGFDSRGRGVWQLCREGKGGIGQGWVFDAALMSEYFRLADSLT
jgi:hypothetical protein